MKTTIGFKKGQSKTWQDNFPKTVNCCRCSGVARFAFAAHEGLDEETMFNDCVCNLFKNKGKGKLWLHDCVSVAIYFCKDCLEATAVYNQG